jgi:BirA family biotin operon repressor/biotin-[acetyl-CoA-carboxylase] ligase
MIKIYKKIGSTQEVAKKLKNPRPWTVVVAEEQTSGYGREKRSWFSPKGGLYFSLILPKSNIKDIETLSLLSAFVISKVIKDRFKIEPFIKLPNDVYLNGKKICGILTENVISGNEIKSSIIGVGLNTNIEKFPEGLKNTATSLKIELKKEIDNKEILKEFIKGLKEQFKTISQ